jgi:hypothetical protein
LAIVVQADVDSDVAGDPGIGGVPSPVAGRIVEYVAVDRPATGAGDDDGEVV